MKNYFLAAFDLQLFAVALTDGIEHWIRIVAAIGGIAVAIYTIRKMRQEYELNKITRENLKLDQQIKQQTLAREILKNKEANPRSNGLQE